MIPLRSGQGVKAQGAKEGKDNGVKGASSSGKQDKKKDEPPAPTPAKREDVVFDVTDKTLQKVGVRSHPFLSSFFFCVARRDGEPGTVLLGGVVF